MVKTGLEQLKDSTKATPKFSPCDGRTIPIEAEIAPHFKLFRIISDQKILFLSP